MNWKQVHYDNLTNYPGITDDIQRPLDDHYTQPLNYRKTLREKASTWLKKSHLI